MLHFRSMQFSTKQRSTLPQAVRVDVVTHGERAWVRRDGSLSAQCPEKSKDIILLTKVWMVKAMVFPVVMYGCESWTIKKAER